MKTKKDAGATRVTTKAVKEFKCISLGHKGYVLSLCLQGDWICSKLIQQKCSVGGFWGLFIVHLISQLGVVRGKWRTPSVRCGFVYFFLLGWHILDSAVSLLDRRRHFVRLYVTGWGQNPWFSRGWAISQGTWIRCEQDRMFWFSDSMKLRFFWCAVAEWFSPSCCPWLLFQL